ncbi:hypothetical protein [uncultured Pseudomonas sp.]|uniref:hypothetical protein n=1 Tax=uncultured Pseudomonas sp. TaxID=114707 RepID=UPI0025D73DA6|nr:hypothetical protein [uncultured Pseudomonas sp.]
MTITIQAKDLNGNKCEASVGDILFGDFLIDTQREDGLFTAVSFHNDDAEIEAYFAALDSDAWGRDCEAMIRAERSAADYRAWMGDDSYLHERRI